METVKKYADRIVASYRRLNQKSPAFVNIVFGALCAALIFSALLNPWVTGASSTTRRLPIYSVEREDKAVSLTFDAAWGNEDTQTIIDILEKYNVKVTFFVIGQWAEKYPESVKALHDAGHEIMTHSYDHAHFSSLSTDQIVENINKGCDAVEDITGVRPTLFRAPYGEYDDHVIAAVDSMGIRTIQWDVDSLDWKDLSAGEIYSRVTSRVAPGSIVLFHNAALHTPEALGDIIEFLTGEGYSIVPVSELIYSGDFTVDHTGRQMKVG